tara:strand:- start:12 stop:275 length:264 start_codon:yes stop_codon:yes gene_type:complete
MIELLKYLANNLGPEQLLEVAHIISQNPEIIDQDTFIEMVNSVEGIHIEKLDKSMYDRLEKKFNEMDEIRSNSELYKLLKDNNIGLN